MSEETITFHLELVAEQAISEVRRLQTLLFRTIRLLNRLGLPEDLSAAFYRLERFILTVRLAYTSLYTLYMATGPIGWGLGAVGVATTLVNVSDFMMGE